MSKKGSSTKRSASSLHTCLLYPKRLRKEILSLTIEVIEALKKFEALKDLKTNKVILFDDLKKEVKQINKLSRELRLQELPLGIKDIESLPQFKNKKKNLELIETKREESTEKWQEIEKDLQKSMELKAKRTAKPKDKLESDLQALRAKMAQL